MTSAQLEPSAHAPCTSTTLRASAGLTARADASAAKSVAESMLMATTATVHRVFFFGYARSRGGKEATSRRNRRYQGRNPVLFLYGFRGPEDIRCCPGLPIPKTAIRRGCCRPGRGVDRVVRAAPSWRCSSVS
jgi:hypothetical protein